MLLRLAGAVLNGSDIVRTSADMRRARRAIPFGGKEMRRRARPEGAEFAHEMRLVGVAVGERKVCPRQRRAHDGLAPRPGKAREPLETLRRYTELGEKAPVQLARRYSKFRREFGHREEDVSAEQTIDGTDDQVVGRV